MFTGLIQAIGVIESIEPSPAGARLVIDPGSWAHTPEPGASIAVSGCCLTLAGDPGEHGGRLCFDVVPQTLDTTALGDARPGSGVNLEHAATAGTLLGGHIVQGHVDGVARVQAVRTEGEWRVRLTPPAGLMKYLTPKGSVCVDGVSLTIAAVEPASSAGEPGSGGWFEVALIPETLERTTLDSLRPEDRINLEADTVAKTVVHYLENYLENGLASERAGR